MKIIDLKQGTDSWLEWRKKIITSTDAAALLGVSPYSTPYNTWRKKLGLIKENPPNAAMLRGQRDEPIARKMFIKKYKINMTPRCIESENYNFIGASLDGMSDCKKFIIEIKSQDIQKIIENGIPEYHMCQIQHHFLATDGIAEKCYYISIWNNKIYVIEVYPDLTWMKNYIPKAMEFWKKVIFHEAPEIGNKDYIDMNQNIEWKNCAIEYKKLSTNIKYLEEIRNEYRKKLIVIANGNNCNGHGLKIFKKTIPGKINYEDIPELKNVDLTKYRKENKFSWTIMI